MVKDNGLGTWRAMGWVVLASAGLALVVSSARADQHGAAATPAARTHEAGVGLPLPPWADGTLDIHHISTGRGNATFTIMPDGTTLLIDAGDIDREGFDSRSAPLKLLEVRPTQGAAAGAVIARYIAGVLPPRSPQRIDYAVITHFHGDHFGDWRAGLPRSRHGDYVRTGITEVAETLPIGTLIDRGIPDPNDPHPLDEYQVKSLANYRAFITAQQRVRGMRHETLVPGRTTQIRLRHSPDRFASFQVRNVKANAHLWDGTNSAKQLFDPAVSVFANGKRQENPLSLALLLSYGRFDYFSGGDNTGLSGPGIPSWFDVETPIAARIGEVDALMLNHHGNRDASNATFLAALRPRVIVQQAWVSDQPGGEVVQRLASRALWADDRIVFATGMADETRTVLGSVVDTLYGSRAGHVVLRVAPGGASYWVFVLDDQVEGQIVTKMFGPFASRE